MTEIEKVIMALECCTDRERRADCYGCYQDGPGFGIVCRDGLMRDALALLKEKGTTRWRQISPARIYECEVCGQNVMTDDIDAYKYCHGCGRMVKWDD